MLQKFLAEGACTHLAGGRTPGIVDAALARVGRERRVAVTVQHFLAAPAIVAHTNHVATLARRVADRLAGAYRLRTFPLPLAVPAFDLAMAWHPRREADPAAAWLKGEVRSVVRRIGGTTSGPD